MKLAARNDSFTCSHCTRSVLPVERGGYRDHCPFCLYGQHVDARLPGDRMSDCLGTLTPIGITSTPKKGYIVLYRCERCGVEKQNKAAIDDDYRLILALSSVQGHDRKA